MSDIPFIFVPLGVGDAFSTRYYSSSLFLTYDNFNLLVDCPHPLGKIMAEASATSGVQMSLEKLDGVALSHLHADHCAGLEGLGFYTHYETGEKTTLVAHPRIITDLWPHHLAHTMAPLNMPAKKQRTLESFFALQDVTTEVPATLGPFTIECRRTSHMVFTTAFRITAGGHTLGLSTDTSYDEELIEWLAESDLIIHETNNGKHTPYESLAALPESIRSRMMLIHYPDDFDTANSIIPVLVQGRRYTVSSV